MKLVGWAIEPHGAFAAERNMFMAYMIEWYAKRGYALVYLPQGHPTSAQAMLDHLDLDLVVCWGDRLKSHKMVCMELGWVPQHGTVHIGASGLWKDFRPGAIGSVDPRFPEWREEYLQGRVGGNPDGYVLVIGQTSSDRSLDGYDGPIQHDLAKWVQDQYPHERIVFRPHPKDPTSYARDDQTGNLWRGLQGAKAVVAISSTVLLDAALMDIPAFALNFCPAFPKGVFESAAVDLRNMPLDVGIREWPDWRTERERYLSHLKFQCQIDLRKPEISARNERLFLGDF